MTKQKRGKTLFGCGAVQKESEGPFLCLLNNFEICSSYKSHSCFFLPTSDFVHQQECDMMGFHSASSDSVPPLATCPACIPLCKHSRNTRGAAGCEGNPFLPTARPPSICLYRTGPAVRFGLWAGCFFFFPLPLVVTDATQLSPNPPPSFTGISYVSLHLNEGKQTYKGSWQPSVNGTCVSQQPRCNCGLGLCN